MSSALKFLLVPSGAIQPYLCAPAPCVCFRCQHQFPGFEIRQLALQLQIALKQPPLLACRQYDARTRGGGNIGVKKAQTQCYQGANQQLRHAEVGANAPLMGRPIVSYQNGLAVIIDGVRSNGCKKATKAARECAGNYAVTKNTSNIYQRVMRIPACRNGLN